MVESTRRYKFNDFEFDPGKGLLEFRRQRVAITRKALQILAVLVRQPGRVVEKESFLQEVWPETYVEESTLAQNILTLRKTLRRFDPGSDFIVTVPRRGYRFVGHVELITSVENGELSKQELAHSAIEIHNTSRSSISGHHLISALVAGDGSMLFYLAKRADDGKYRLNAVEVDVGSPMGLAESESQSMIMSPDGKAVAFCIRVAKKNGMTAALASVESGEVLGYPPTPQNDGITLLGWSGDGDNLYAGLRHAKSFSLWQLPINGGEPIQLRPWESELSLRLVLSGGGQHIYYEPEGA
jgi:DNA-binding winged helix-turn-helix (wHTH) protein